eukprot:symbB.v1.2.029653.t2/scaffold3275.1/size59885/5
MDCIPEESSERDEGPDCDRVVPSEEENSEFSSAPSLSRQCTEFSDVVAQDLMSRQLSDFAARQGDFWIRKCSEPVPFNGAKGLDSTQGDFRRQSSCPPMMRSEGLFKEPIQELEIEPDLEEEEEDDLVSRAICAAVGDCDFSVAVADPTSLDTELIAVSEGFEQLTGYTKEEAVGENCRFLSDGCELPDSVAEGLRKASESGAPYKSLLVNKRKTGEFFLNLLSIRGLVLARNTNTGEEIWILVSVQQDVTGIKPELLPSSNDALLMKVASRILRRLLKYATEIGIACLIQANGKGRSTASNHFQGGMHLLSDIAWKDGESLGAADERPAKSWVKACGNSAQWRKAVNVLESSYSCKIETNAVCHTAAISACERSGEWQIALKLLTGNVVPNLVMYNAALNACATGAQWQLALDLFLRILNQRLQVDVISYNSLSLACEEAGNWRRALEFLQLLETVVLEPNAVSYGILICTYGAAWRWQDALWCLSLHLETDLVCCTSTIGACGNSEQWQWALHLLHQSHKQKVEVNAIPYTVAISACEDGGHWLQALALLQEFCLQPEQGRMVYNAAASTCEKANQWTWALTILSAMSSKFVEADVVTYNACVAACEKGSQWQQVLSLMGEMQMASVLANLITYNAAITACANVLVWFHALCLLQLANTEQLQANVISYSEAVRACRVVTSYAPNLFDLLGGKSQADLLPPQKVLESLPQAFAHLAPPEPHEPVEPPSSGVGSKMLIWPLVFSSMTVAVMVLLLQRKRQKATFSSPVASSQKLSIKQVSITRLVSDVAVQLCYGVRLNMEVPEPEFITALTTHFPEAGFVTKLPSSRPGSEFLALVQRVHQGVSLQVTDCQQGLFRHCLDAPKLRQLREDAGMADQDGCTTVVSADGVSGSKLRLELRFQLQSAALLARLEMEAAATMPAVPPEAQHFLEELRGFVLSALSTSMSSSTSAGSRAAPVTPPVASPPRSISAPAALGQVSSPEPRADVLPRPAPAKKRAPGSLVDPHRKARRGGGAKPFQLSET